MLALAPWKLHAVNLSLLRRGLHGYQISTKWNTYGRIWMCQTAPFISLIICQGTLTFWRRFCQPSTLLRSFFFFCLLSLSAAVVVKISCLKVLDRQMGYLIDLPSLPGLKKKKNELEHSAVRISRITHPFALLFSYILIFFPYLLRRFILEVLSHGKPPQIVISEHTRLIFDSVQKGWDWTLKFTYFFLHQFTL